MYLALLSCTKNSGEQFNKEIGIRHFFFQSFTQNIHQKIQKPPENYIISDPKTSQISSHRNDSIEMHQNVSISVPLNKKTNLMHRKEVPPNVPLIKTTTRTEKIRERKKKVVSSILGPLPIIRTVESLHQFTPIPPENPPNEQELQEDDDVIPLSQKIDIIDVDSAPEDDEKMHATTNSCSGTCNLMEQIAKAKERKDFFKRYLQNLATEKKLCELNVAKITNRHESTKDFLGNISSILTQTQKDIFFGLKRKVVWQHDEIQSALMLRYLSKEMYLYLREELKYPLPSFTSLATWEKQFPLQAVGVQKCVEEFMQRPSDDELDDVDEIV